MILGQRQQQHIHRDGEISFTDESVGWTHGKGNVPGLGVVNLAIPHVAAWPLWTIIQCDECHDFFVVIRDPRPGSMAYIPPPISARRARRMLKRSNPA